MRVSLGAVLWCQERLRRANEEELFNKLLAKELQSTVSVSSTERRLACVFDRPSPLCLSTDVAIREAQIKKEFEARNHMQEFYAAVRTTFYTYSSASSHAVSE